MVFSYCIDCRRVKIDIPKIKKMAADFDEQEDLDKEELLSSIDKSNDAEELEKLTNFMMCQTSYKADIPTDCQEEIWVVLSDQEWGAIETILNSSNLLYLVDNYRDYPVICPDCLKAKKVRETADLN